MKTVIATEQTQREDAYYVRKEVFVKEQEVPVEIEIDELEDKATHFVIYNDDKSLRRPLDCGSLRDQRQSLNAFVC